MIGNKLSLTEAEAMWAEARTAKKITVRRSEYNRHRNITVGGKLRATNGSASLELRGKRHEGLQSPYSS